MTTAAPLRPQGGKLRIRSYLAVFAATGLLTVGLAAPASAVESDTTTDTVGLFTVVNGEPVRVDDSYLRSQSLDLNSSGGSSGSGEVSPQLIDWNQWFGCFSLNNTNDVFANYMFWWDGAGHDVRLKCGQDGTSGWGYKHIREGKESQWQAKLDGAKAAGWNAAADGVESWDDLMSGASGTVILYPDNIRLDTVSHKWCTNNYFFLQDLHTGAELYSFRVEAVWASDSDRLITSFPSNRSYC